MTYVSRINPLPFFWFLTLAISSLAVTVSFGFEYLKEIVPCYWCSLQRGLWVALLLLSISYFLIPAGDRLLKPLRTCLLLAVVCSSLYHSLLITGVVEERCSKKTAIQSKQDLLTAFDTPKPCNRSDAVLFGVPAPLMSLLGSTVLLVIPVATSRPRRS